MLTANPPRRRPALILAISFATGVFAAEMWGFGWSVAAALIPVVVVLVLRVLFRPARLVATLGVATIVSLLALAGALRLTFTATPPTDNRRDLMIHLADRETRADFFGRVAAVPVRKEYGWEIIVDLRSIRTKAGLTPLSGRARWRTTSPFIALNYGDYLRFSGHLEHPHSARNPGGFDYARFLRYRGIDVVARINKAPTRIPDPEPHIFVNDIISHSREWIRQSMTQHLDPTARAVVLGLLLGDTDTMPREVIDAFRNSGTLHLLAVSGSNVWLFVALMSLVLSAVRIRGGLRFALLVTGIVYFSFLTRNEPSVVRAAIMAGLVLFARWRGYRVDLLNIMGVAALVILVVKPYHLFMPGFQLSFAAVTGIGMGIPRLVGWMNRHRWTFRLWKIPRWFLTIIVSSFCAAIATAPLLAWHFQQIPTLGVITNVPLGLLAAVGTYSSVALLTTSLIAAPLTPYVAALTAWTAHQSVTTATFFSGIPGSLLIWSRPGVLAMSIYVIALALLLFPRRRYRIARAVALPIGVLLLFVTFDRAVSAHVEKSATLRMTCLSIPHERGMLVQSPDGTCQWVAPRDEFSEEALQWVIEPFCHSRGISVETLKFNERSSADHRIDSQASAEKGQTHFNWSRWRVPSGGTNTASASQPCLHRWINESDTVVNLVRWCDTNRENLLLNELGKGCDVLILPLVGSSPRKVRQWVSALDPQTVIFDSWPAIWQRSDWFDLWSTRYPNREVFATAKQGAIDIVSTGRGVSVAAFSDTRDY